jgi:hypothetical protein
VRDYIESGRQWFGMWAMLLGAIAAIGSQDPRIAGIALLILGLVVAPYRFLAIASCILWFAVRSAFLFPRFRDWRFIAATGAAGIAVVILYLLFKPSLLKEARTFKQVATDGKVSVGRLAAAVVGFFACLFCYEALVYAAARYQLTF